MQLASTLTLIVLAQAQPAAAPSPVAAAPLEINSALDFLLKGGWAMIPIGLCSLLAFTLIAERLIVLRRGRIIPRGFLSRLSPLVVDRQKALELCRENRSLIARILEVAIKYCHEPSEILHKRVEETGQREVVGLRHHMRLLSALPQVSTMLGLLGTVFGMIKTFQSVAATSEALGKTEMLAKGIFEAWTCTAAGLLIAIPVLIAYHYLMGKIDSLVAEIDRVVADWLEQHGPSAALAANPSDSRHQQKPIAQPSSVAAVAPA